MGEEMVKRRRQSEALRGLQRTDEALDLCERRSRLECVRLRRSRPFGKTLL
jgi:hypothetical protein